MFAFKRKIFSYLSDNIPVRRFVSWSHVVEAVDPHASPTISPCCLDHPSTILYRQDLCLCMMHRLCVLGTGAPEFDFEDPKLQCFHRYSTRSRSLSRERWQVRSTLVHSMSVQLWYVVLVMQDPKSINSKLLRQQWAFCHRAEASPIECSCLVAVKLKGLAWLIIS